MAAKLLAAFPVLAARDSARWIVRRDPVLLRRSGGRMRAVPGATRLLWRQIRNGLVTTSPASGSRRAVSVRNACHAVRAWDQVERLGQQTQRGATFADTGRGQPHAHHAETPSRADAARTIRRVPRAACSRSRDACVDRLRRAPDVRGTSGRRAWRGRDAQILRDSKPPLDVVRGFVAFVEVWVCRRSMLVAPRCGMMPSRAVSRTSPSSTRPVAGASTPRVDCQHTATGAPLVRFECVGEPLGRPHVVVVQERDVAPGCRFDAGVPRGRRSAVVFPANETQSSVGGERRTFGARVVDDDAFEVRERLPQNGRDCLGEERGSTKGRYRRR